MYSPWRLLNHLSILSISILWALPLPWKFSAKRTCIDNNIMFTVTLRKLLRVGDTKLKLLLLYWAIELLRYARYRRRRNCIESGSRNKCSRMSEDLRSSFQATTRQLMLQERDPGYHLECLFGHRCRAQVIPIGSLSFVATGCWNGLCTRMRRWSSFRCCRQLGANFADAC